MEFALSEQQRSIQELARKFAETELKPLAGEADEKRNISENAIQENGRTWFYRNNLSSGIWWSRFRSCYIYSRDGRDWKGLFGNSGYLFCTPDSPILL